MEELNLSDYILILRRWKKLFLAVFVCLFVVCFFVALSWSKYRATATVKIEQPEISTNATSMAGVKETMQAMADQRISEIQQRVLSTSSLVEIITKFDLYSAERANTPIAVVAEKMRKQIKVDLLSGMLANPAAASRVSADQLSAIAFDLSFTYTKPLLAQQVTDELTTRFLDEDLKERRVQAQETTKFLGDQIAELEASLSQQEKKIAEYQKIHGAARPEALAFNQQAAATISLNLQSLDTQIAANEGTLGSLRAQLVTTDPYSRVVADGQVLTTPTTQLKALQTQYASLTAQYGNDHPDVVKTRHQIEALQTQVGGKNKNVTQLKAQITDVRTNLEAARKTYGPEHPDVISLQGQLQKLESQMATQRTSAATPDKDGPTDADNPVYMQLVAQLRAAEEQHKTLQAQRESLAGQQAMYQKAVIDNPETAMDMAALGRDYENSQMRYRELKAKKMSADMEETMQKNRKGARMSLINPPELPLHTQPRRLLILFGGLFASLIGSLAAVIIAQISSQSIVGPRHLESILGVAPLVVIPHIYTAEERALTLRVRALIVKDGLVARLQKLKTDGVSSWTGSK